MGQLCVLRVYLLARLGSILMDFPGKAAKAFASAPTRAIGLGQSMLIAVAIAIASFFGIFMPVDGRVYDVLLESRLSLERQKPQILLIDSPVTAFSSAEFPWERVVAELLALGARQVVFTVFPEGNLGTARALLENPAVILGTDVKPDPQRTDRFRLNLPATFNDLKPHAVADTAEALLGVHRYQRYSYQVGDEKIPSVEALSVRRLGKSVPEEGRFLIDFSQSGQFFPHAKLQQVLQGGLVKDVVEGRVVLIGIGRERFHRSVVTPITDELRNVPKLDYHGYAVNSLLIDSAISSLNPIVKALLLLATWLVFFVVAQPMGFRSATLAGTVMVGGLLMLAWLALQLIDLHVPVVGSVLVIGTTLVSIGHRKSQHHDRALAKLVNTAGLALSSGLSDHRTPRGEEFWPYALGMIDQAVPVTRAMLLQRLPGSSSLHLVHALRCASYALIDPAPDLSRPPYSSTNNATGAVRVEGVLMPISGEHHQFVAPLASKGELLGYLVFGTGLSEEHHPALLRAVTAVCRRLAEMIEENRQYGMADKSVPSFTRKYLTDRRDEVVARLNEHLMLATKQSEFLVAVLNFLQTPTMVYDLFGRPLFTNASMKPLLKEAQLNPEGGFSAADLIEHTCGLSSEEARLVLTDLTVEGREFDRTAWAGTQQYRLRANMLGGSSLLETSYQDTLQRAHGVMFQMIPVETKSEQVSVQSDGPVTHIEGTKFDVWQLLEAVVADVSAQSDFQGLTIALGGERVPAMTESQQSLLRDLLYALAQLLAYDCVLPGRIAIDVQQDKSILMVTMVNEGFGMPNTRLQTMLEGPVWPQSGTLRRIRQLRSSALGLGESLELTSTVGGGYRAQLVLEMVS